MPESEREREIVNASLKLLVVNGPPVNVFYPFTALTIIIIKTIIIPTVHAIAFPLIFVPEDPL